MRRNIRSFLVIALIFTVIASVNILGAQSNPSKWAEIEVGDAIKNELVHTSLRSNYQTPIKRYEYVLLALDVLKKSGVNITVQQEYVFNDIIGHPYEKEILKAYHAGVISGYGNKLFKPDDNISRQEVATLVVKLIKKIDSEKTISGNSKLIYSDSTSISAWARESIDYCYANGIMEGTGKDKKGLDLIKPLGTTTREESVLLIYRLANVEKIINTESAGTVKIDPNSTELVSSLAPGDTFDLTNFARTFSGETANQIIGLDNIEDVAIIDMTNDSMTIIVEENTTIYLAKFGNGTFLDLTSIGAISQRSKQIYMELLTTLNNDEAVVNGIDTGISNINLNNTRTDLDVVDQYSITINVDNTVVEGVYLVKFFDK